MKMVTYAICLIAFTMLQYTTAIANEPTSPVTQSLPWKNLATNNIHAFLEKVTSKDSQHEWKFTTDQTISNKNYINDWNSISGLKVAVLKQLQFYPKTLPDLTTTNSETVAQNASLLQDFRDLLMENPNCDDLCLVDTVNRVLFVCLARHIVSTRSVCPEVKTQVQRLHKFLFKPSKLASALAKESTQNTGMSSTNGAIFVFPASWEKSENEKHTIRERERVLEVKEYLCLFMQTANATNMEDAICRKLVCPNQRQLPDTRTIPVLIWTMMETDSFIHNTLPLLCLYVEKNPTFTLDDNSDKISATLALSKTDREQYGSYLAPCFQARECEVSSLLNSIQWCTLEERTRLNDAQRILGFKPSKETLVQNSLMEIEATKTNIKKLRSLSLEDIVSLDDIRSYWRGVRNWMPYMPTEGGEYQVGTIGIPAKFICADGKIISIQH